MRCGTPTLSLLLLMAAGGCSVNDLVGELSPGTREYEAYCARPGPVWIQNAETGHNLCAGRLAARAFPRAVCSRGLLTASSGLTTSSREGSEGEASVWVGGTLTLSASAQVGGSLHVNGPAGLVVNDSLSVTGELHDLGSLLGEKATLTVGRDAWVHGRVELGSLTMKRFLHLTETGPLKVTGGFPDDQVLRDVSAPPDFSGTCDSGENVAGLVESNRLLNHNAFIPLQPEDFADVSNATRTLELPCGRFFLERITGTGGDKGTVHLVVKGRSALFVKGDTDVGALEVQLEPGAQLDLFIGGSLRAQRSLVLDSGHEPSHLRVYVGGTLELPAELKLEGLLYAPAAELETGVKLELFGAMVLKSLTVSKPVTVQYDPELGGVEAACSDAG